MLVTRAILIAGFALVLVPGALLAQSRPPVALTGIVTSDKEGAMEGVVVSAKRASGAVTISVATDDKGRFSFPSSKLEPGSYALSIRAVGYELDGPKTAEVPAAQTATADLKLGATKNLAKQLSNAEWFASFPGTDQQKKALLNCVSCHNLDRIVRSQYDADQFMDVFNRMVGYYPGSTPEHPQRLVGNAQRQLGQGPGVRAMAEYLASVNASQETRSYQLQTLPRPKGKATQVIYTE